MADFLWNERQRIFVRFCTRVAKLGILKLHDDQLLHFYKEAATMAKYLDDRQAMMEAFNNMGLIYKNQGRYDKAINCQQQQLKLAEETQDKPRQIDAHGNLANIYVLTNNTQKALECFEKLRNLLGDVGHKKQTAEIENSLGVFYSSLTGQHEKAVECFQKSLPIFFEIGDRKNASQTLFNLGKLHTELGKFHEAVHYFTQRLEIERKLKDRASEGATLMELGKAYDQVHDSEKAKQHFEASLDIAMEIGGKEQDDPEKCDAYLYLANAYRSTYDYEVAIKYSNLALETAKRINYTEGEGKAYETLGLCYDEQGDLQNSLMCYQKLLELAKCSLDQSYHDSAFVNIASAYQKMGNNSKAIEVCEKALNGAINDMQGQAVIYGTLGYVYEEKGELNKAIEYHKRQLDIETEIGSMEGQAKACSSLGVDYKNLGKYYESIGWYKKSLDIATKLGDDRLASAPLSNLGILHEELGEHRKAFDYFTKCLEISRKVKDRYLESSLLTNLCIVCSSLGDLENREKYVKKSLKITEQTGSKTDEAIVLGHLVRYKIGKGQYDEALELVEKQLFLSKEIDNKAIMGEGWHIKGSIYILQQKYQKAEFCFEKVIKLSQDTGNKRQEAAAYSCLGRVFLQKMVYSKGEEKDLKFDPDMLKAVHFYEEALHCYEEVFEHIQDQDQFKISFLEKFIADYNLLAMALIMQNKSQEALIASERGRSRALNDLLTLKYGLSKTIPTQREPISYEEIQQLASTFPIIVFYLHPNGVFSWLLNREECHSEVHRLGKTSLTDSVDDAYSVLNIRGMMWEERLIETEEHHQRSEPLEATTVDIPDGLLADTFKRCVYDEEFTQPLEGLYELLIAPVMNKLTEEDEIVIIPEGSLYKVPFAALKDPNTESYLSETKRIRLAPSLTSLKTLQDCPADFHSKSGALVIGNPQVGEVMFRGKKLNVSRLPGAEREAKMIGEVLGVQPILGSQATKEAIKHHLRQGVALVHFAAHGTHDGEIFLTPPPRGNQPQGRELPTPLSTILTDEPDPDYILTMKDVQESDVHPQLVVLSCCHSGRGEVKADGVIGMTRAFLAAGARAVVASLWAIDDDATMVFMEKFYSHLKQRKSASTSLHLAMKDMRGIPRYSEPRFWAPFFLIGDDVTVEI